jgi:DNA-directed RNA polymerase specialized sigma24 family protein
VADNAVETCLRALPRTSDGTPPHHIDDYTLHRLLHDALDPAPDPTVSMAPSSLRCLLLLPRVQRKLLLLVTLDHLSLADAADIVGLELDVAARHLNAARSQFRALVA